MKNSIEAKYFYVYYSVSFEYYGWSIRESENEDFYIHLVNGTHADYCFEYGALVDVRHIETLINLLNSTKDDREYLAIIKTFSEFI